MYSTSCTRLTSPLLFLLVAFACAPERNCGATVHLPATVEVRRRLAGNLVAVAPEPTTTTTASSQPVELPEFSEPIGNHTVALGKDAQLACRINRLGNFRTAWLRVEDKGILTIHNNVITRNYRVGLQNNDEGKNFVLTIKNVQPSDRGGYMCQPTSVPLRFAVGYLDVLTPPSFEGVAADGADSASTDATADSADGQPTTTAGSPPAGSIVVVREGASTTLSCRANGHPAPTISWRREDGEPILVNGALTGDGAAKLEGPSISLHQVSRLNSGAYLCIASNGVQPSASRRLQLDVQYAPVIRLPDTEIGAQLGQRQVRLSCHVELNPLGSYHWVRVPSAGGGARQQSDEPTAQPADDSTLIEQDGLTNSDRHEIVMKQIAPDRLVMELEFRQLQRQDFGWYKCIARNSLGTQSNSIRLYESSGSVFSNMFRAAGEEAPATPASQGDGEPAEDPLGRHRTSGATRTHTRSSWVQRTTSRESKVAPDASSSAPPTRLPRTPADLSLLLLLISHLLLLLLLSNPPAVGAQAS